MIARALSVLVLSVLQLAAAATAQAQSIDVEFAVPGGPRITAAEVRGADPNGGSDKCGRGKTQLRIDVFRHADMGKRQQLVEKSRLRNGRLRLFVDGRSCVFLQLRWGGATKLKDTHFLPSDRRPVKVCAGLNNTVVLPKRKVAVQVGIKRQKTGAVPSTVRVQWRQSSGLWQAVETAGPPFRFEVEREQAADVKVEVRAVVDGERYPSDIHELNVARAASGGGAVTTAIALGPKIWREIKVDFPARAASGWTETPGPALMGDKELESLAVISTSTPLMTLAGARRVGHEDEAAAYGCRELRFVRVLGDRAQFTAECPLRRNAAGQTVYARGRTKDSIGCKIESRTCSYDSYFRQPKRVIRVCLNDQTGTALARHSRPLLLVARTDGRGTLENYYRLKVARNPNQRAHAHCPYVAEVDGDDARKEILDTYRNDRDDTTYTLRLTSARTSHDSARGALVLAEGAPGISVFGRPVDGRELRAQSFTAGLQLLALAGGLVPVGRQPAGRFIGGDVGGALVGDTQWMLRPSWISAGLLLRGELVRTRDWIERAPGEFETRPSERWRLFGGVRIENLVPRLPRFFRLDAHAAAGMDRQRTGGPVRFVVLYGVGAAIDFSRRVRRLALYLGLEFLHGSRSESLRYRQNGDFAFSRLPFSNTKLRLVAGLAWHPIVRMKRDRTRRSQKKRRS